MVKWKNSGKKMLVFLLVLGLMGGMINPLQFTVAASEKEAGEIPKTDDGTTEETAVRQDENGETEAAKEPAEEEPADGGTAADEETAAEEESAADKETTADEETVEREPDAETVPEEDAAEEQPSDTETIPSEEPVEELPADTETASEEESIQEQEVPVDLEAAAVKELIETLPTLEELKTFDQEAQDAVRTQFREVFEAYENLTEEQRVLLAGAEKRLLELMEYFTEPVTPMAATEEQIKGAWNAMTAAMVNWEQEVDLSTFNITEAEYKSNIWPGVVRHNPDLFYIMDVTYYPGSNGVIQKCTFTYNTQYNRDSVARYRAAIDNVFDEVITANMNEEQKATALHDYLVQHMVYDQNANNSLGIEKRNAYEALVNGIGVCEGYTLAYAALLEKAGIEVGYCKSTKMNHIWNYVKLNGNWYHADLTYDDITAASQTGETGYVKHTYFLLSDSAMEKGGHNWDAGAITCSDTRYDNSWHKTAPLTESAIYAVNGNSYYLRKETVENNQNICRGAALMQRDVNGNETQVASFEIENLGSAADQWPMFSMSFSRLSCSKGVLYFNVGNSVYSYRPGTNSTPVKIYTYSDAGNRIVTGLLVNGGQMTLELSSHAGAKDEKITVPVFGLSASETNVKVGYTKAPVLTANSSATNFVWSIRRPNESNWETINGANGSSYTMETGLAAGSYGYRVTATLNGVSVSDEIIITVVAKETQKNFGFSERTKTVIYGDADFTLPAEGAAAGASVRYVSSDPSAVSVDSATGQVKILKAGSATITATASETADYLEASASYEITVSPKALSWDVTALEAADRLDLIGEDRRATLYGELRLSGILDRDMGAVRFDCPADKLSGVYETAAEGSQKVRLSWKNEQDKAALEGTGKENYTMPSALPEMTGRISAASDIPLEPVDGTEFKLQVESGITKVPDTFKDQEHLNTPGKIEKEMKLSLQKKFGGITETNMAVYDVELLINIDGMGWKPASKDNFPADGLTVTMPYPTGTGKNSHNFVAAHMFTADMNGFRAGDVEYPAVTKTEKGITFKVHGLSPVAIGWEKADGGASGDSAGGNDNAGDHNSGGSSSEDHNSGSGGSSNGGNGSSNGSGNDTGISSKTVPSATARANAPSTGDPTPMTLYMALAAASLGGVIGLLIHMKKRRY